MRALYVTLVLASAAICSACTTVNPWEKGTLARPEMALSSDPLGSKIMDHVYHSKEGSSSASTGSGGGCGCN